MDSQTKHRLQSDPSGAVELLRYAQRMHRSAQTDDAKRLFALYVAQATCRLEAFGKDQSL